MKLLIILSVIACSYAAKLDRTYLPPASASSAGGSPDSLNTPFGFGGQVGQSSRPSNFAQPAGGSSFGQSTGPSFDKISVKEETFRKGQLSGSPGLGQSSYASGPNSYAPSGSGFSQQPQSFNPSTFGKEISGVQGPSSYSGQIYQPERARASIDKNGEILRYENENDGDNFAYSYETSNGISAEESGVATNGVQAQGGYSYTADDGQVISVAYTADENGFQPRGDHLPTPPPIPDEILKSIEDNARAAAAGTQEGAYRSDENDSVFAPQQYSKGTGSSYDQDQGYAVQKGVSAFNQPQAQVSQQYGVPNAGVASLAGRPLTDLQGFNQPQNQYQRQDQVVSQQYGGPNAGVVTSSGRPSAGSQSFDQLKNQYQAQSQPMRPAQTYNAVAASSGSRPLTGPKVYNEQQNQNQPQAQGTAQEYGTPSRPAMSISQASNQLKPNQYYPGSSQPGQFLSTGSIQGFPAQSGIARSQNQDASGYQYNRPQGSSQNGRESFTQDRPSQLGQLRPETKPGQQLGQYNSGTLTQGSFPTPSGTAGQGFSPASGTSVQGSFGRTGSSGQPQLSQPSGPNSSMREQSGYNYNLPGTQTPGGSRPQQPRAQQTSFRPNSFEQGKPGQSFGGPRQPPSYSSEEGYKY